MPVVVRGNIDRWDVLVRRAQRNTIRAFTIDAYTEIKRESPVRTGDLRAGFNWEYAPQRLRGRVYNQQPYAGIVAAGGRIPAHTVRPRRARALRFRPKGSREYIFRMWARIPARTVPSTPREARNIGFHMRGINRAQGRVAQTFRDEVQAIEAS